MHTFLVIFICTLASFSIHSMDELDISSFVKIPTYDTKEMNAFLYDECKKSTEQLNDTFFASLNKEQWHTLKALPENKKNKLLLKVLYTVNDLNYEELRGAIACLVCAGAQPDQFKLHITSALERAAMYKDLKMIKFLLQKKANPNLEKEIVFWITSLEVAQLFHEAHANFKAVNSLKETLLHKVVRTSYADPELIPFFIIQGVNVNQVDSYNDTPLHSLSKSAGFYGDSQVLITKARLLVEAGASLNAKNKDQQTAIEFLKTHNGKYQYDQLHEYLENL